MSYRKRLSIPTNLVLIICTRILSLYAYISMHACEVLICNGVNRDFSNHLDRVYCFRLHGALLVVACHRRFFGHHGNSGSPAFTHSCKTVMYACGLRKRSSPMIN